MSTYFPAFIDLLDFCLELLLVPVEILLILRLYEKVYGPVLKNRKLICSSAIILILLVTCFFRYLLHPVHPASAPPITVVCSFLFLFCFPRDKQKKILYSGILLTVSFSWLLTYDFITTPSPFKNSLIIISISHIVFWLILEVIRKLDSGRSFSIPGSLWLLLLSITLASMFACGFIEYYSYISENPYLLTIEVPVLIIFLFINLSLFVFFDRFSALFNLERDRLMLAQQLQLQNKHYHDLEIAQNQIRSIHHDMKNYIHTAVQLSRTGEGNQELKKFLENTYQQINQVETLIQTGNYMIDTVLNIKMTEMKQNQIQVHTDLHIPVELKISFQQCVTVLGNLLDNAMEACLVLPPQNRWIQITLSYVDHVLYIRIENPSSSLPQWQDSLPVSEKNNPLFHGLGLKNVQKAVEENGTMEISSTGTSFLVRIALYDL